MKIQSVASGKKVFDWNVPDEWEIFEGYIEDSNGNKVVDFEDSNLHVVGYSVSVDAFMSLEELQLHLFSDESNPAAIPYVTSYYKKDWGFCLSHDIRKSLTEQRYHVKISSRHFKGEMNYGELRIKGNSRKTILLTTYVCHPSMANNEVSGPVVMAGLAKHIERLPDRNYSYRILFLPETIGAISYIAKHLRFLKRRVAAGWVLTCIGDDRAFSYLPSRYGNTYADKVTKSVFRSLDQRLVRIYSWLDRGSDERQFCSPGVDLPVCSVMRSKYSEYPEYHTSLDDMSLLSPESLEDSLALVVDIINQLEANVIPTSKYLCEPRLGKRGLYPELSELTSVDSVKNQMDVLSYCDGKNDLISIGEITGIQFDEVREIVTKLALGGVVTTKPFLG